MLSAARRLTYCSFYRSNALANNGSLAFGRFLMYLYVPFLLALSILAISSVQHC